ncbi:hypothetical protein Q7P35_005818 [Cladosporium inversicolor]
MGFHSRICVPEAHSFHSHTTLPLPSSPLHHSLRIVPTGTLVSTSSLPTPVIRLTKQYITPNPSSNNPTPINDSHPDHQQSPLQSTPLRPTTMGCGTSEPAQGAYSDQNAPRPVQASGPPPRNSYPPNSYPPNGYPPNGYPPQQQQQQYQYQQQQQPVQVGGKTKKTKAVKAASNLGLLSILAG